MQRNSKFLCCFFLIFLTQLPECFNIPHNTSKLVGSPFRKRNEEFENQRKETTNERTLSYLQNMSLKYPVLQNIIDTPRAIDEADVLAVLIDTLKMNVTSKFDTDIVWASVLCMKLHIDCPAEVSWSEWSLWTDCNARCGGGLTFRSRSCLNYVFPFINCIGPSVETLLCNTHTCPPSAKEYFGWSNWSLWKGCDSCRPQTFSGYQRRMRCCKLLKEVTYNGSEIQHGEQTHIENQECQSDNESGYSIESMNICDGPATEMKHCSKDLLSTCDGNPYWSSWSEWSCSVICGIGRRTRWRACLPGNITTSSQWRGCHGQYFQHATCFPRPCQGKMSHSPVLTFNGLNSWMKYNSSRNPTKMFRFFSRILPYRLDGTLLFRSFPSDEKCFRNNSNCEKLIHIALIDGYIRVEAKHESCFLELRSSYRAQLDKWTEISVSIEDRLVTLRCNNHPISSAYFVCDIDALFSSLSWNWNLDTYIGSRNGIDGFFFGALSKMAINFNLLPLYGNDVNSSDSILVFAESHNINSSILMQESDDSVIRIGRQENIPLNITNGSKLDMSFAFRIRETSGLLLSLIVQNHENTSVLVRVFIENNHHLQLQCFVEDFSKFNSNTQDCFQQKIFLSYVDSNVWQLLEISKDDREIALCIDNHRQIVQLNKNFQIKYMQIGGSDDLPGIFKTTIFIPLLTGVEMDVTNVMLGEEIINPDTFALFNTGYVPLGISSIADVYREYSFKIGEQLILSCETPSPNVDIHVFPNEAEYSSKDLPSNSYLTPFHNSFKIIWFKSDKVIDRENGYNYNAPAESSKNPVLNLTINSSTQNGFYTCLVMKNQYILLQRAYAISIIETKDDNRTLNLSNTYITKLDSRKKYQESSSYFDVTSAAAVVYICILCIIFILYWLKKLNSLGDARKNQIIDQNPK